MDWLFNVEEIALWLKEWGIWAVVVSILLNIVISILAFVPSIFLSGANAIVFGLVPGYFISLIGETFGAAVSFWLFRFGLSKIKKLNHDRWEWLQAINQSSRKKQVLLLFIARLTPFIPSGLVTGIAAISKMRFIDFFLITLLGKSPSIVLETLIGHDMIRMSDNLPRLLISLAFVVILFVVFKNKSFKK